MPPRPKGEKTQQQKRRAVKALQRRRAVMDYWLNKGKQDVVVGGKMKQYAPPSFREIGDALGVNRTTVMYDLETALAELSAELKAEIEVDVKKEFARQLDFAKELREAAREYLSDETDPLRIILIPRADEIDVSYFDFGDTGEKGEPKKKTATLHALLAKVEGGLNIEADKVNIKHVDIRKFALDAISVTDSCIDKFAKLGGEYTKEKENPQNALQIAKDVVAEAVKEGIDRAEAVKRASERYGVLEADLVS